MVLRGWRWRRSGETLNSGYAPHVANNDLIQALSCEVINVWRRQILDKRFRNFDTQIHIRGEWDARRKKNGRKHEYFVQFIAFCSAE
jgi:hypothetical protein